MKILYLGAHLDPTNSEAEIARSLERLGHDVVRLGEHGTGAAALIEACKREMPAVLLGAKYRITGAEQMDLPSANKVCEALRLCRPHVGKIVLYVFDALMPNFRRDRWQWAETLAPAIDVFAATDGSATARLPNGFWLPQGSSDLVDHDAPWPTEYEGDVLFLGSKYGERGDLLHELRARFGGRFRHYPSGGEPEIRGRELTAFVRLWRVCLCPLTPTWPRYWSNRIYTLSGHGALVASPVVSGMDEDGWQPNVNYLPLPTSNAAAVAALAEHLARDPAELDAIRRAGYEHARSKSYDVRCRMLLERLN